MTTLHEALQLSNPGDPFPWQCALLDCLNKGIRNRLVLDVPTGLGKTTMMADLLTLPISKT